MENQLVTLPAEVQQIAENVSVEKRNYQGRTGVTEGSVQRPLRHVARPLHRL